MGRKESCGLAPEGLGCKSHKLGSATWSPVPTETVRQHSIPAMVHQTFSWTPTLQNALGPLILPISCPLLY